MHQTFYIDIDEEITLIVSRLRKAKARDIIIVVPKRALLIQSIVNLKLLKKEADNLRKKIIIVTQDKLGKLLIEKTGIAVEQRLDDISGEEISVEEEKMPLEIEMNNRDYDKEAKERLANIGSLEYFEEDVPEKVSASNKKLNEKAEEGISEAEKITNKELVIDIESNIKGKKASVGRSSSMDIVKNVDIKQSGVGNILEKEKVNKEMVKPKEKTRVAFLGKERGFTDKKSNDSDKVRDFFQNDESSMRIKKEKTDYKNVNLSGRFWKFFLVSGIIALITIIFAVAYLFLPKVNIKIFAKTKIQSLDMQIRGDSAITSIDQDNLVIPAKLIVIDEEISEKFDSTGNKSASNQKAHGTITIYNEYSSSPQTLVATTRFLSENGKIFRLSKTIIVPGTTNVGGETKPGAIEAEVAADEPGGIYNIEPTTFTIPGFQGSGNDKYSKFYAKSFKAMIGGKDGEATVKMITARDISSAKNLLEDEIKKVAKEKIKNTVGQGGIVLDDAINFSNITYSFSNTEGEIVDSFTGIAKVKASAIIFSNGDVVNVALNKINKNKSDNVMSVSADSLALEFGKSDTDFTKNTIIIRVHASGKSGNEIDLENLKKGILGKSEDDFKAYLKSYSQIESVELSYWPPFLGGKIPSYESRVNIELDNK